MPYAPGCVQEMARMKYGGTVGKVSALHWNDGPFSAISFSDAGSGTSGTFVSEVNVRSSLRDIISCDTACGVNGQWTMIHLSLLINCPAAFHACSRKSVASSTGTRLAWMNTIIGKQRRTRRRRSSFHRHFVTTYGWRSPFFQVRQLQTVFNASSVKHAVLL